MRYILRNIQRLARSTLCSSPYQAPRLMNTLSSLGGRALNDSSGGCHHAQSDSDGYCCFFYYRQFFLGNAAVYAAVVEQWASNPEVDGAFCGRPWHPLHTQAICGGVYRSRLLTLGTTEPFACRCPDVNKMLQMFDKKSQSVIQVAHTFGGQISSHFFTKNTTNASLCLYQIVICRKKRQKKSMFKTPLNGMFKSMFFQHQPKICLPSDFET